MNKELQILIEKHGVLTDKKAKMQNQVEIGRKVNEIISENVNLDAICEETGFSKKQAAERVMNWIITCTKI